MSRRGNDPMAYEKRRLKRRLLCMQRHKCIKCDIKLTYESATMDHVIPVARTGSNDRTNFVILCYDCNQAKGDTVDTEIVAACKRMWASELGRQIKRAEQTTAPKKRKPRKKKSSGARVREQIDRLLYQETENGLSG